MHIKQVSIRGFRSYKDIVVLGPLKKGQNIIVGHNGAGKSNILNAIQFVLGDEFSHLQIENKIALLHETNEVEESSAFVKIVFDNCTRKLHIDADEVKITRVLTAKKDQYYLDNKCVLKSEIITILETAGFSKSNPYYVVKQGQISQLAVASDLFRLQLVCEVAGIKVYEAKKRESSKVWVDAQERHTKCKLVFETIEKRIESVKQDNEMYQKYEELTSLSKAMNHILFDREISSINNKLDALKEAQDSYGNESSELRSKIGKAAKEIENSSNIISSVDSQIREFYIVRTSVNTELEKLLELKAKLENSLHDYKDGQNRLKLRENFIKHCDAEDFRIKSEMTSLESQFERLNELLQSNITNLNVSEASKRAILDRPARLSKFSTKEERNSWLEDNIKIIQQIISDYKKEISDSEYVVETEKSNLLKAQSNMNINENTVKSEEEVITTLIINSNQTKSIIKNLSKERNEWWKEISTKKRLIESMTVECKVIDNKFRSIAGKGIQNGIDSIKILLDELKEDGTSNDMLSGYYGTLIENFNCEDVFNMAVESSAGSRLFYHIVQNDSVASRFIKEFNKRKLKGELNFLPLSVLRVYSAKRITEKDACSLISKLSFDDNVKKAVEFVFNQVALCRNLESAGKISRQYNVDCVTLEGDKVLQRGSITGGFMDIRNSKIELKRNIIALQKKIDNEEIKVNEHILTVQNIEGEINRAEHILYQQEDEIQKRRAQNKLFIEGIKHDEYGINLLHERLIQKLKIVKSLKTAEEQKQRELLNLHAEMSLPFSEEYSQAEKRELDQLTNQIINLNKTVQESQAQLAKNRLDVERLQFALQNSILKRKDLLADSDLIVVNEASLASELAETNNNIKETNVKIQNISSQINDLQSEVENYQAQVQTLKGQEEEIAVALNDKLIELNKITNKKKMISEQRRKCTDKLHELGSILPQDIIRYKHLSSNELICKLKEAQSEICKFGTINIHAISQCNEFLEIRQELATRISNLDKEKESIKRLLESLDAQKEIAVQTTLKKISENFSNILKCLCPLAEGSLILRRNSEAETDKSQKTVSGSYDYNSNEFKSSDFSGVGIKVKFSPSDSDIYNIQQLSGGQKALLALVFIFAIQKCDPAPFYLFDEIDQSLDSEHRIRVAQFINENCTDSQFITTTFRSELLEGVDNFFAVKLDNRVSHINRITHGEALSIVQSNIQE